MSNRYEIQDQIGKGGLGAVYRALDTQLQREVAIKRVLTPDQATEEEVEKSAQNLIAEAQTLSSLNHPNIITVFDVSQDEKGGFVVMELLKGETLDETIERGVLTQEDFTEVVYQTMEALIAAQACNVIHRDIKPTNIMVVWQASGKFQTKILDFGLAKFSKSPSVQTMDQEESVLGSIFFMAPEQFERGELDARTDLYQMGCVYYNALTGQYPFNGETAPQVMNAHLQHRVIPLEQVRPDLSPSICQWVMWLINKDIDHRPADAREALKQWPRNPESPSTAAVAAMPVEDTPEISTGDVRIVTGASQAYAPPALIVGAGANSAVGARTGRLAGGTGTVRPNLRRSQPPKESGKMKWVVIGSIISAILLFIIIGAIGRANETKRMDRLTELSSQEQPTGTSADIDIALGYLEAEATPPAVRSDATKVLERLDGVAIDETLLKELEETESEVIRVRLSSILAERNYTPAVGEMLDGFRNASTDQRKVRFLDSVRAVADMDSIDEILDSLKGDHSLSVRGVFEDTVLAVLRKEQNAGQVVDDILTRVSTTSGNERKSLFRILGAIGGEKVKTRLASIYKKQGDPDYQRDAMIAYLNWLDRSVLPEVEAVIKETDDKGLRSVAERAYARLSTLPGPETTQERVAIWKKAFQLSNNPNDVKKIVGSMVETPSFFAKKLLLEWNKHPSYGSMAKSSATVIDRSIASAPVLKSGDVLKGNKARVQGDSKASINSFLSSLTSWTSPETWFSWNFKVAEEGTYKLVVEQAYLRDKPSEFVIYLPGKTFKGESKQTATLDQFVPVTLDGTVSLKKGQIYTLMLAAGKDIQPRMMDIGAIKLVKQ